MTTTSSIPPLIHQKLAAFEHLEPEFEASFQFVQDVHGQKRMPTFPVEDTVRYLHALWVCDRKTYLLSVSRTVKAYEGRLALELLRRWQLEADTAGIVIFLQRKLDMLPLEEITLQVQKAQQDPDGNVLAQRLAHGRSIMLNRGMNLLQALDAIFGLSEAALAAAVRSACGRYGHLADQIDLQLEESDSVLYSFAPHQLLAQRNMVIMNKLGIHALMKPGDLPGQRSWHVTVPERQEPFLQPFAEHVIHPYQELISPWHNNLKRDSFVDRPEHTDEAGI